MFYQRNRAVKFYFESVLIVCICNQALNVLKIFVHVQELQGMDQLHKFNWIRH